MFNLFQNNLIFKGKLVRTTQEMTEFAKAHAGPNIGYFPPATLEQVQTGQKHMDHDIQMSNLEQLLNRMIIDNGRDYTINAVLNLIKTTR